MKLCKQSPFAGKRRVIHRTQLASLLIYWGVQWRNPTIGRRQGMLSSRSQGELWDYFETAKAEYRNRIKQAHPDYGGSAEQAALLNAHWDRTKQLFSRLGIE